MNNDDKKRILILNGPNLNMLGIREPEIYGTKTYGDLIEYLMNTCEDTGLIGKVTQSNHEGDLVDAIQDALGEYDGLIINGGAYSHTSLAIADAVKAVRLPAVEVHLTDISRREEYRRRSFLTEVCEQSFFGEGFESYGKAIRYLGEKLK